MGHREFFDNSPELVNFCERGRLLGEPYRGDITKAAVIHDANEALVTSGTERDGGYEFWPDLCEREYAKLGFDCPHWLPGKIDKFLIGPFRQRTDDERLVLEIPIIWDAVQQDIWFCMASRNSKNPGRLFDLIEEAYLASGWPCGWKGRFPHGQLVVFSRG